MNLVYTLSSCIKPNLRKVRHLFSFIQYSVSTVAPTIHQTITGRARFYKHVTVAPVDCDDNFVDFVFKNGNSMLKGRQMYKILLDGKTLKTPGRHPLHIPSLGLATAIAGEWDNQIGRKGIQPVNMPLMSLACTAIDQVSIEPKTAVDTCMKYLSTDSALFYASNDERILLRKQKEYYQPVLRWLKRSFKIELQTTQDFTGKLNHSPSSVAKIQRMIESLDPFSLTCLQAATMEFKSIVLALAFFASIHQIISLPLPSFQSFPCVRYSNIDQATAYARVEEEFQAEIWGVVEGGHDMDRLNCSIRLTSVSFFLGMLYNTDGMNHILDQWKSS